MGHSTIYPTGATVYNPNKAWSGYTVFQAGEEGVVLIDMNGKEVHLWKGLLGFPAKIFQVVMCWAAQEEEILNSEYRIM